MLRLRYLVPVLGLSSLVAAACSDDGGISVGGDAGDGGEAVGGDGPGPGPGGGGGDETGAGGGCSEDGTGTVSIEVTGLPEDVAPDVLITGPEDLVITETLEGVAAGAYAVTAARVYDADPIVRTVFDPTVTASDFCLTDGGTHTIEVTYAAIPSSNKLWMPSGLDDELAAFSSQAIAETGITDASVAIDGPGSGAIAFDRDGNLWAIGPTVADPHVVRFPAASLGESATLEADIEINLAEIACVPSIRNLAFDPAGNLWLSVCGNEIHRIAVTDLTTSGSKTSDVLLTGAALPEGLAFDIDGNLWVAGGPTISRFGSARLGETDADPPDLELAVTSAPNPNLGLSAVTLAFDADGNLWGLDFGLNAVFQVAAGSLNDTGMQDVQAAVSFVVDIGALLNTPAFDDGGGLWLSLASDALGGTFGRFSPDQLGVSSGTGAPVVPDVLITSASVSTSLPVAFFPAPAGLPLFHSLPAP